MITIDIREAKRITDSYSAFLSFDYNAKIVNILRELPVRFYDKNHRTWEVPVSSVNELIDKLQDFNIKLIGKVTELEPKKVVEGLPKGFEFKTQPYSHQIEGVEYGLKYDKWFLGDEQGCISGECYVKIKENGKPATRDIKLKHLISAFNKDSTIKIKSMINGRFGYLPIKAVVPKGVKPTIKITLEDTNIVCTEDHLIYTENGWIEAGKLKVGNTVFTNGKQVCPICGSSENLITYPYSKFYGYCKSCMYKLRNGTKYNDLTKKLDDFGYVRLFGRATRDMPNYDKMYGMGIYEHHQVWYEHTGHIVDTTKEVVHHKNGIKTDNRFENLQLMTIREHDRLHSDTKKNHLYQFNKNLDYIERNGTKIYLVPKLEKVIAIETSKPQEVYDIEIDDDEIHNFICNNIVVHNCGKSKQAIDIAVARKIAYNYKHCLIVCGVNTLKWNWVKEVHIHSDEGAYILGQRTKRNGRVYIGSTKDKVTDAKSVDSIEDYFIITNIESFRSKDFADAIKKACLDGEIDMCVADEIHKMKNPSSQQSKGFLKCLPKCRIAMTGTPLMNNPLDLYIILKWLGYEAHSFYSFKLHYCVMGGFNGYDVIGYQNMEQLTEQFRSIMLRRLKADVLDLPDKIYIDDVVDMTDKQSLIYNEVRNDIKAHIDQVTLDAVNPLSALIRLRQATGYTGILSSEIKESAKLDRMEDIVEEAVANGDKCIIFSNWTQMTGAIIDRLGAYNPALITGNTKDNDRTEQQDKFMNDDTCKVIVGTIGAMGTGLTLTAGSTVIFLDEPWNKALFDQAVDRAHRIGTKNNVTIYSIMCRDTIDERIHDLIYKKGQMSDAIVDGKIVGDKTAIINYLIQ